jgi:hypothetical protein
MRTITFTVDETLIERARIRAANEKRSLDAAFRDWLVLYAGPDTAHAGFKDLMEQLSNVRSNRSFSRDELNGRC